MVNVRSVKPAVYIPEREALKWCNKARITIQAGTLSCEAVIHIMPEKQLSPGYVKINQAAARLLKIPVAKYRIYYSAIDRIFIGPLTGILTSAIKKGNPPSGKTGRLFKELIQYANRQGVLVYLFNSRGVLGNDELIRGISIDKNGNWINGLFPWPDIVYNRIRFRKIENKKANIELLRRFEMDDRVHLFNSRFLNKLEVHQALSSSQETRELMPNTINYLPQSMRSFIGEYKEILVKPVDGSIGKGIVKIKTVRTEKYACAHVAKGAPVWNGPFSMALLQQWLYDYGVKPGEHLLQQSISLARYEGKIFDLRTQVQKNQKGQWVFTGAGARVAGKGRFVTHIPNGGKAARLEVVFDKVFSCYAQRSKVYKQLQYISEKVPLVLEEELGLNLAILSMDIGIDTEGRLWLFEVNSKPSSFDEDDIRHKHLMNLTGYIIYSAEQIRKRKGGI